jgi:signal transduction histidine kinase
MRPRPLAAGRRLAARTPLQVKLIVALLLVAVALALIGLASVAALDGYLVGRLDRQLEAVARQPTRPPGEDRGEPDGHRPGPPSPFLIQYRDPAGEVGRLGRALNTMLAQIESAFGARAASEASARRSEEAARRSEDRMRRFVADASHELRTPLTTIRGFAELYRQGAGRDPAEPGPAHAPDRGPGGPDGAAGRGPPAGPARPAASPRPGPGRPARPGRRGGQRRQGGRPPTGGSSWCSAPAKAMATSGRP